jgi:hypothetical protein
MLGNGVFFGSFLELGFFGFDFDFGMFSRYV